MEIMHVITAFTYTCQLLRHFEDFDLESFVHHIIAILAQSQNSN